MNPEMTFMSQLSEDETIVLKAINVLRKATPVDVARKLGDPYTPQDMTQYLRSLEGRNLVNKIQENPLTYEVSPLGLIAIGALSKDAKEVFVSVPSEKCFFFYTGTGPDKFTKLSACNLSDLRDKAKVVDVKSLEFHVPRGDIEKWLKDVLGDSELAKEIERIRPLKLQGEALRARILRLINSRIEKLTRKPQF